MFNGSDVVATVVFVLAYLHFAFVALHAYSLIILQQFESMDMIWRNNPKWLKTLITTHYSTPSLT